MTTLPSEPPSTDPDSPVDHDVAVIGAGASGLAAAVFTSRYGLETVIFDGGKSAIKQCAHIENYLGFPGGITPERFLDLGRAHARHEGAAIIDERVIAVDRSDEQFVVKTADSAYVADRVVVAAAYDGNLLAPLTDELPEADPFVRTDDGRTAVDGLYVTGWMSNETVHQVGVNAGHGARVGLALSRDDMSERYWPAVGERYVDWVVHEGRYGGEGWDEHIEDWFDREMRPDEEIASERIEKARNDLAAEFLDRCIGSEKQQRKDREGQLLLLEQLDDEVVLERAREIDAARVDQ